MSQTRRVALGGLTTALAGALLLAGVAPAADASTGRHLTVAAVPAAAVTSVGLKRSFSRVFPVKDGYRDSVQVEVKAKTTGAGVEPKGTAVLKRGKKVVTTWKLSAVDQTLTWNGRDHGEVKPATYHLTVSLKGQEGSKQHASTTLVVDKRSLHARTITVHRTAMALMKHTYYDFSQQRTATCTANKFSYGGGIVAGAIYCEAQDDARQTDGTDTAVLLTGSVKIPAAVRHAEKYRRPFVKVKQHTSVHAGDVYSLLDAGTSVSYGKAKSNGASSRTLRWTDDPKTLNVQFRFGQYAVAGVNGYTITWHYSKLS